MNLEKTADDKIPGPEAAADQMYIVFYSACKCILMRGWTGGAGVRGWRVRNRGWRVRNRGWRGREAGVEGAGSGDRGGGEPGKIGAGN